MNKTIIISLVFFLSAATSFAIPLEDLISQEQIQRLQASESGLIVETQIRNPASILMPANDELRQFVDSARGGLNPNKMVEVLFLYRKPDAFHTSGGNWDAEQRAGVFNQLLAISSMTGIKYFSASRNAMHTFYEFSAIIDGPQSRNTLADPVFEQPPETLTLFARQRDLTFGDNVYRYDFVNRGNAIFFFQENITSLSVWGFPAIRRNNLRTVFAVFDNGDTILIYAVSMARAASIPGMGNRIANSFTSRAEALINWLTDRLDNYLFAKL